MIKQNITRQKPKWEIKPGQDEKTWHFLMLFNDDIHTFDYVIDSLVNVCKHDFEQAEQCAYITHYKGKCEIKKGSIEELDPYKNGLDNRGLTVGIE